MNDAIVRYMRTAVSEGGLRLTVALLFVVVLAVAAVALKGLAVMILVGIIFPNFGWATWGYGLSVAIGMALNVVGASFKGTTSRQ